jgi:phospholipase C
MKLATLDNGKRDGKLIIISSDNKNYVDASHIAKNLQEALDNWEDCKSKLEKLYQQLNENNLPEGSLNIFFFKKKRFKIRNSRYNQNSCSFTKSI